MSSSQQTSRRWLLSKNPRKILPQILVTLAVSLAYVTGGATRGWTSPVLRALLASPEFPFDRSDLAWLASLSSLSGSLGFIVVYPLQHFGRRRTLIGTGVPLSVGFLLLGLAYNKTMLFAGRILLGGSLSASTTAAQIYISECASPSIRGSLGTVTTFALNLGILLTYVLGSVVNWDELGLILVAIPLLFMAAMLFTPESPVWLITKGRHSDASKALQRLRGQSTSIDEEMKRMQDKIAADEATRTVAMQGQSRFKELFKRPVWHPFILVLMVLGLQPLVGEPVIVSYAGYIFEEAAIGWNANQAAILLGVAQLLGVAISGVLVDRAGRRFLLMASGFGTSIAQMTLATYFYFKENGLVDETTNIGWLPVTAVTAFALSFSIGFANVPLMLMGEMFPTRLRSFLCSCCFTIYVFVIFVVVYTYPFLTSSLSQARTFYIYGTVAACSVVIVFLFLPETKGKSLAHIEEIFSSELKIFHFREDKPSRNANLPSLSESKGVANETYEQDEKF